MLAGRSVRLSGSTVSWPDTLEGFLHLLRSYSKAGLNTHAREAGAKARHWTTWPWCLLTFGKLHVTI